MCFTSSGGYDGPDSPDAAYSSSRRLTTAVVAIGNWSVCPAWSMCIWVCSTYRTSPGVTPCCASWATTRWCGDSIPSALSPSRFRMSGWRKPVSMTIASLPDMRSQACTGTRTRPLPLAFAIMRRRLSSTSPRSRVLTVQVMTRSAVRGRGRARRDSACGADRSRPSGFRSTDHAVSPASASLNGYAFAHCTCSDPMSRNMRVRR